MIRFLQRPTKLNKILIGGILVFISFALVYTLVPGGTIGDALGVAETPAAGVVARVGDQQVTVFEVQRLARRMGQQQVRDPDMLQNFMPFFLQRAAESLIVQRALEAEAERLGLQVTEEELRQEMRSGQLGAFLFPGGNFIGREQYEAFAASQNLTVQQFEREVRRELLVRKLAALVESGVTLSDAELEQEFRRRSTRVKLRYAVLSAGDLAQEVRVTEEELRAFFERNQQRYENAVPEARRARYALVDRDRIAGQVQVTRDDLQRYYNENMEQFREPEAVKVSHILIRTPLADADGKRDEAALAEARQRAEEVLRQARAGADFAALARKHSEDPGSQEAGGSLGWVERGRTVPEFEKTAFALEKGQTSDVVESSYGFHIIRVEDKRPAQVRPLDEVRAQIEPVLKQEKVERAVSELVNTLQSQARSMGLEAAAQRHDLRVITTGFVPPGAPLPEAGMAPDLSQAIFAARQGAPAEVAETPNGHAVFEVLEVREARSPTFEEWRQRIEADFRAERAQQLLVQRTEEMADRARSLNNLQQAARQFGARVQTTDWVTADSNVPGLGSMGGPAAVAFTLKPGAISPPIPAGSSGAVLVVTDRQEPSDEEVARGRDELREELLESKRNETVNLFAASLRKRMQDEGRLRINQAELDRLAAVRGT